MKKFLYVIMVFVLAISFTLSNSVVAVSIPRLGVGSPSSGTVEVGGTIRYPISIYNSPTSITLKASDVRIAGVTANISIEGSGNSSRTIVLSNIQGSVGSVGYISYIAGGVATNERGGNREMNITSSTFTIVATVQPTPEPQPVPQPQQQPNIPTLPPQQNNNDNNNNNNNENPDQEKPAEEEDKEEPKMEITGFSSQAIQIGQDISFQIKYTDNKEMGDITLNNNDIKLYGFKADIEISGSGNNRTVTLKNVQGNLGGLKYVKVAANTAKDKAGNSVSKDGKTGMFSVVNNDTKGNPDDWIENPNTGR